MIFGENGIEIGHFTLSYFGLISISAMFVFGLITAHHAKQQGEKTAVIVRFLVWALIAGIIFGRLSFIVNPPAETAVYYDRQWFLGNFLDVQAGPIAVWSGGLDRGGIMLGIIAAGVAIVLRERLDVRKWADIIYPGLMVGLVILPLANLVNGDLMGRAAKVLWWDAHPVPGYASLWAIIAFALVIFIRQKFKLWETAGRRFQAGMLIYLPGMFILDFMREGTAPVILGISGFQIMILLSVIVLLAVEWVTSRRDTRPQE